MRSGMGRNVFVRSVLTALSVSVAAVAFAAADAEGGWQRPRTTRRYLHPPLAESILNAASAAASATPLKASNATNGRGS